jgi:hypothetical protein
MEIYNETNAQLESVLCSAQQPDKSTGRCILYCGHPGMHQTFVAEWQEGAAHSRRRQTRSILPSPVHTAPRGLHQPGSDNSHSRPRLMRDHGARWEHQHAERRAASRIPAQR